MNPMYVFLLIVFLAIVFVVVGVILGFFTPTRRANKRHVTSSIDNESS